MYTRLVVAVSLFSLTCFALSAPPSSAADDWKAVDPAHAALKSPLVEKDADAEVLFWEVWVNDAGRNLAFTHYISIKVFTERGKETQSTVDIPYLGSNKIVDIAGRTIKPDGTIVDLKKEAVFERTIVKVGGVKIKAKSFAMPSVEPGAILEYRWREVRPGQIANNLRLELQREIPVQSVKYFFKPLGGYAVRAMYTKVFNGKPTPLTKEKDGYFSISMSNLPAFHEEPHMPPEDQVRTWMLVYYAVYGFEAPQDYWPRYAKEIYEVVKQYMKVNDEVKKATAEAVAGASSPEAKLEKIFDFCRTRIKNVADDASGITESEREKMKENQSPSDTLKRGMGTGFDIDMLFAAMATTAGFEARIACLADRGEKFFDRSFTHPYFLKAYNVAVKVADGWRFFDPASTYVPFGMLRWQEEGMPALIADPSQPAFVNTPLSPPERSMQKRTAKLRLSEDGTLEGDVRLEYTGQLAVEMKEQYDEDSPEQREQNLRDSIKKRLSAAEVTVIRLENVTEPAKPFVCSYHVRVPGYAERTGKRLFLQPAFFQKGNPALFSSSTRKYSVYFHYPWKEQDDVTIELPRGFVLDNADQPSPFNAEGVADYNVKIVVINKNEALQLNRTFSLKGLVIPETMYGPLKRMFDMLHENDNHTITLKQAASTQ